VAHPDWPIIYIRGYAMRQSEIEETSADPFCGFNLGSTVFRATSDRKVPRKYMFESPVLRLAVDYQYATVFDAGLDIVDEGYGKPFIPARSIVIYRYYDDASRLLGTGAKPDIKRFGADLGKLIARVRDLVCHDTNPEKIEPGAFRCYLVAHSMGGLVARAFLQDPTSDASLLACVDKAFTYATPHNGIEMAGLNVPEWLGTNAMNTFNRETMADYLNLKAHYDGKQKDRVDWLPQGPGRLPADRFFTMIGTNRSDYEVAAGLSRTFAGNGSDGLVRIENAGLCGIDSAGNRTPCPNAFAYRSHSGYFGIVNSEEAYQNLVRFLFGNVRVDVWLDIESVTLPPQVEAEKQKGRDVNALYQFEILASLRGCAWFLTRRTSEEDSVACRTYKQLTAPKEPADRSMYLSTIFMSSNLRKNPDLESIAYAVTLGVRTPDYEVDRKLWLDEHFEGGYIFRDTTSIEIFVPKTAGQQWTVVQSWAGQSGSATRADPISPKPVAGGKLELAVDFEKQGTPGVKGKLRFLASAWK
jgi:hypothetical protein